MELSEFIESLTGFDELDIRKHFQSDWNDLLVASPTMFGRALAFVWFKRQENLNSGDAKKRAMELSIKQVNDMFEDSKVDTVEDSDSEEPISEPGKD